MRKLVCAATAAAVFLLASCGGDEMTLDQLEGFTAAGVEELLARIQHRPFPGFDTAFVPGVQGGTWNSDILNEPRTFNRLVAEGDADSMNIQDHLLDVLAEYDAVLARWRPRVASWEIVIDEDAGTMDVYYTLRDDVFWTYPGSDVKIPVTSRDFVFWHNEIVGVAEFQSSGFSSQFVLMEDGSTRQMTAHEIDERTFRIHIPRIIANPIFHTNMTAAPAHHFEPALRSGGPDAVRDLFNISVDPRSVPSMGRWHMIEYSPGQRILFARNPHFWERGEDGLPLTYFDERVLHLLPDLTTQSLLFQQGTLDAHIVRPDSIGAIVDHPNPAWTVFHNRGAMSSGRLWTFNMNTVNEGEPWQEWFSTTEFRQAMSSMLNRDRVISQVDRGLSRPMEWWFPPANAFHNPDLRLQWTYSPARALELLASIGMARDAQGVMRDANGNRVAFDIAFPSIGGIWEDIASIIVDELAAIGITVTAVPTDFQRLVEQLMGTFDWQTLMIGLGGPSLFPTQGTNVWLSSGNLHMWHPNQETPVREWEARKDWLFREGMHTFDEEAARPIWDEFQEIMLYQTPMIWMTRLYGFYAVNNRWDLSNFYFDNLVGVHDGQLFLRDR